MSSSSSCRSSSSPLSFRCLVLALVLALTSCFHLTSGQAVPPVVTGVSGCASSSDGSSLLCSIPYSLTLSGLNFNPNTDLVNLSSTSCTPYSGSSPTSLICTQPNRAPLSTSSFDSPLPISVIDLSTGLTSSILTSITVQSIPPILLTSISGCVGSGAVTTNCDLSTSVLTVSGSGFQQDAQPWYLIYSMPTGGWYTDFPGYTSPVAYPITGGPTVVLPLNYTLRNTLSSLLSSPFSSSAQPGVLLRNGSMGICFSHGNTLSNCLSLSWWWSNSSATAPPIISPLFPGIVTDGSMAITSVIALGCPVVANSSVVGCAPPFSLAIEGTNLPTSANSALVSIGNTRCIGAYYVGAGTLQCSIPNEYTASPVNTPLPLTLVDAVRLTRATLPAAVVLSQPGPFVISSISGCSGDMTASLATSGCSVLTDMLTLTGSGFAAIINTNPTAWQVVWSTSGFLSYAQVDRYITNTSTIVLPLSTIAGLLASATSSSVTATLCLVHGQQLSSTPCITVGLTLPAITVSGVSGCQGAATAGGRLVNVTECQAGVSLLTISGSNFFSTVFITVAGQSCPLVSSRSVLNQLVCTLPIVQALQPGVGYDVVVTAYSSSVSLPSAVSFTAHPTIYSVTSQFCPFVDYPGRMGVPALYCPPNATLTIVGSYFSDLSTLAVQLQSTYSPTPLLCGQLQFDSSDVLTCTLPQPASTFPELNFFASQLTLTVTENATFFSNPLTAVLYASLTDPHVNAVQGCAASVADTRGVTGCHPGDVITLVGSHFPAISQLSVQLLYGGELLTCTSPKLVSSTELSCTLPYVAPTSGGYGVPLSVRLYQTLAGSRPSNWLSAVDFAPLATSSSSEEVKFFITLSVLLPVVVLLLLLVAVLCWQRQRLSAAGEDKDGAWVRHAASDDGGELQMGEVKQGEQLDM